MAVQMHWAGAVQLHVRQFAGVIPQFWCVPNMSFVFLEALFTAPACRQRFGVGPLRSGKTKVMVCSTCPHCFWILNCALFFRQLPSVWRALSTHVYPLHLRCWRNGWHTPASFPLLAFGCVSPGSCRVCRNTFLSGTNRNPFVFSGVAQPIERFQACRCAPAFLLSIPAPTVWSGLSIASPH